RSAAKDVTDPVPGGHRRPGQPSRLPMAVGLAVRPIAAVRSTRRPAGEVIPATRPEPPGWLPAGPRPFSAHIRSDCRPNVRPRRTDVRQSDAPGRRPVRPGDPGA